jgi:Fe-S-cluster-containing dehydrogenase component
MIVMGYQQDPNVRKCASEDDAQTEYHNQYRRGNRSAIKMANWICEQACPVDAIYPSKQLVRGIEKWYVDFDKCIPFFTGHRGCGICIAECPWSRPGVGPNLAEKMLKRRTQQ